MITEEFAAAFATEWAASWNSHDLDRILNHYSDDFKITTPMASRLLPVSDGTVSGKTAVRAYWTVGLERIPDLKFEVLDVLTGIDGLTVYYRNTATGRRSVEMMLFNKEGKVSEAIVHYAG